MVLNVMGSNPISHPLNFYSKSPAIKDLQGICFFLMVVISQMLQDYLQGFCMHLGEELRKMHQHKYKILDLYDLNGLFR